MLWVIGYQTSKKENKEDDNKEEIPFVIDKATYDKLNEKEKAELTELMEGDDN